MRGDGKMARQKIENPKQKKAFLLTMEKELFDEVEKKAKEDRRSVTGYITNILAKNVKK
jgi:hypothetical protein